MLQLTVIVRHYNQLDFKDSEGKKIVGTQVQYQIVNEQKNPAGEPVLKVFLSDQKRTFEVDVPFLVEASVMLAGGRATIKPEF